MNIIHMVIGIAALLIAAIAHEFCHGFVAYKLGDSTAKNMGRLTLNPLVHIDPIGSIFLPLVLILLKSPFVFGWAKPVPVNFFYLKHPRRDMILVSLAGPGINLFLSMFAAALLRLPFLREAPYLSLFLVSLLIVNLVIALFNLIPIPPLDGSRVLMGILPYSYARFYARLEPYGFVIIIFLLWLGVLNKIIWPIIRYILSMYGIS